MAGRSRPRCAGRSGREFVGAEREAAFAIHLPGEAQRQAARSAAGRPSAFDASAMARALVARRQAEWFRPAGGSSAAAGSANASNNANPAGASPDGAGCWSSAAGCGATGCSTHAGALGCDGSALATAALAMWRLAASRYRTQPAPVAARSARCCRRRSERRGCHRENRTAKQPQVASMPGAAPNPCNRSSRMAPFASSRPASRAICRRCRSAGPKVFSARAAALAAPNRRAPAGLAHRIRVPSAVHSQAGRRLAA